MLAKLLALLLQSKAAAISAVLVVSTTGAVVSASTQNGMTTVAVTPATQSQGSSPSTEATTLATGKDADNDAEDNDDKTAKTAATCDTTALRDAVKAVNTTFSQDHTALMHVRRDRRGSAARQIVESTDRLLKQTRQAAVQAILATSTCAKQDDEDNETETDNDTDEQPKAGAPSNAITFTEADPKGIADDATNRMTLAFNDAKTQLAALPASAPKNARDSHRTTTERPEDHD
jgi:hypothetical protein